jgi:hypothetical protein
MGASGNILDGMEVVYDLSKVVKAARFPLEMLGSPYQTASKTVLPTIERTAYGSRRGSLPTVVLKSSVKSNASKSE